MLRSSPKSAPLSLRLPPAILRELDRRAARDRRSRSEVAAQLLEEHLLMERFPGLFFATHPSGRWAHLRGTRLKVWEIAELFEQFGRRERRFLELYPHLTREMLGAALAYAQARPEEMRAGVEQRDRSWEDAAARRPRA